MTDYFEVEEDGIYYCRPIYGYDRAGVEYQTGYEHRLMISKEAFIEAYNKWIKGENGNDDNERRAAD